jgi:RsiW-degrading membrane proteinase PrsW (M82 family)
MLGALTLTSAAQDTLTVWLFPALHVLAVSLPVLALLSIGAQRTNAPAGRIAVQFLFGGTLALLISVVVAGGLLLALGAVAVLLAGQATSMGTLVQALMSGNLSPLGDLRATPVLLAAAVLGWGILIPLVQEATKALTIPLWPGWEPTRERALAWGLAAGLGFALTESMWVAAPGADMGGWWPSMVTRAGAALVHGMGTALVGVMWWRGYANGRRLTVVLGYLLAVVFHAFWNIGAIARSLVADTPLLGTVTTTEPAFDILFADLVGIIGTALLLALLLGLLLRLTRRPQWAEEGAGD